MQNKALTVILLVLVAGVAGLFGYKLGGFEETVVEVEEEILAEELPDGKGETFTDNSNIIEPETTSYFDSGDLEYHDITQLSDDQVISSTTQALDLWQKIRNPWKK